MLLQRERNELSPLISSSPHSIPRNFARARANHGDRWLNQATKSARSCLQPRVRKSPASLRSTLPGSCLVRPIQRWSASALFRTTATAALAARASRHTSARERGFRNLEAPSAARAALACRRHLYQTDPYETQNRRLIDQHTDRDGTRSRICVTGQVLPSSYH